jgi:hypothetical protein
MSSGVGRANLWRPIAALEDALCAGASSPLNSRDEAELLTTSNS